MGTEASLPPGSQTVLTTEDVTVPPRSQQRTGLLEPLRLPRFRHFMAMMVFFTAAIQLETVANGWLVFDITRSNLLVGLVTSMWNVTLFIFSPLAGALVDRFDRRRIVIVTWAVVALVFVAITVLIAMDAIQVWHLVVAALINGLLFAFNIPARVALISELVGDKRLMGAMAMVSVAFNVSGVILPLVGGGLIDVAGARGAYGLIAALYVLVGVMAVFLPRTMPLNVSGKTSIVGDLFTGVRFIRTKPAVAWLLLLAVIVTVFGQSYSALLPGFAADTLRVPASGLGLLFSVVGLGALAGNLFIVSIANRPRQGLWMFLLGGGAGLGLIGLGLSTSIYPALAALLLLGITAFPFNTLNQTLIQLLSPLELRGRIQSLYMLTWAAMPIGTMTLSALADGIGIRFPLLLAGVTLMVGTGLVAWRQPGLLDLPGASRPEPLSTREAVERGL